jgi:p-cumate 2,3-dioxygenase alpha subunit
MNIEKLIDDRPDEGIFRVHRSAMTSQEIFDLEQEKIFGKAWLFVGHETEIEENGEFRRRNVGGRPLIFVRGNDGEIRVLFNACTHRGAMVCREHEGKASAFTCLYHAWRFNNKGDLVGVLGADGYSDQFHKLSLGLRSPPRVESYRGFWFVNYDENAEDLITYLGGMRTLMDLTIDAAEALGGWKILPGMAKYSFRANWKLLVENSVDGYHLAPVHASYLDYMSWRQREAGIEKVQISDATSNETLKRTRGAAFRNGHGAMIHGAVGRAIANPSPMWEQDVQDEVKRIWTKNVETFGEERGRQMSEVSRHMVIFPNMIFQDSQTGVRIRQIWPVAPDLIDVLQWDLVPRNEREDLHASRMEYSLAFLGPGGLATPDDAEALEACQRGFAAREVEWSDISRGMTRTPQMNDELQMRAFWRGWRAKLTDTVAESTDDREREECLGIKLD